MGPPPGDSGDRTARSEGDPAEVEVLGECLRQHLHFDIAPRKVCGKLARQQVGIRAREIDITVKVDAHGVYRVLPAFDPLGLVNEDVGAAFGGKSVSEVGVEFVFRFDGADFALEVRADECASRDSLGLDSSSDKIMEARLSTPADAGDHFDQVDIAEQQRLIEVAASVTKRLSCHRALQKH